MNNEFETAVEDGQSDMKDAPELKVVEGKEGPNNEVVYEYDGELFYVDREKKEVVKAKKSDLEDANHDVVVKDEGESSEGETTSASNRMSDDDKMKDEKKDKDHKKNRDDKNNRNNEDNSQQ